MILQRYTFGSKSQPRDDEASETTKLLMILQRYTFGSKSQPTLHIKAHYVVAYDIAKIYIWKQITTYLIGGKRGNKLLMILQRYTFGSKSQLIILLLSNFFSCL